MEKALCAILLCLGLILGTGGDQKSLSGGMMLSHFAFGKRGTLKSAPPLQEQESEATADLSICRFEQEVRDTTISMEHWTWQSRSC